ncbi:MAG: hypothetical protein ACR2NA_06000 [Solirubrobacterales bacterium]
MPATPGSQATPGPAEATDTTADATRRYGSGAAILSVGIGITGLVTYGYFALASHTLSKEAYGGITLLWSAVFITVSVLYRPVEQLLSRTIAERRARNQDLGSALRVAGLIQLALGVLFAVVVLALKSAITDELFGGRESLYWVLVGSVLAYAVSYYTRGLMAGHQRFGFYGLLVFLEATSRICFALVAAVGLVTGQTVVALGVLAAPLFSLLVVPWALGRRARDADPQPPPVAEPEAAETEPATTAVPREAEFTLANGSGFAVAVLAIMASEQTFLNAGPLAIKASEGAAGVALAGFVFNILLIARAPLQLFQAIATSLLPHLTSLRSTGEESGEAAFRQAVTVTLLAVAGFAGATALVMLAIGPTLMQALFGDNFTYDRAGLVIIAGGMGLYLAAATINQATLAQGRARRAAVCWLGCAALFVGWILVPVVDDPALRVEVGFTGAALVLVSLLGAVYAAPGDGPGMAPGSGEELEARLAAADEAM